MACPPREGGGVCNREEQEGEIHARWVQHGHSLGAEGGGCSLVVGKDPLEQLLDVQLCGDGNLVPLDKRLKAHHAGSHLGQALALGRCEQGEVTPSRLGGCLEPGWCAILCLREARGACTCEGEARRG